MKLKILLFTALLAGASLFLAGCASPGHERSGSAMMEESLVTTKVKSALLAEKDVNSFDIKVETFNGTVQLSGFVDSQWQIDKAVAVTSGVDGVQHIRNNLIHKPRQ
jgi:hyperosmotically inducible periplasmic protein